MRKDSAGQRLLAAHYRVDGQPHINTIQVINDTWIMNSTFPCKILDEIIIIKSSRKIYFTGEEMILMKIYNVITMNL